MLRIPTLLTTLILTMSANAAVFQCAPGIYTDKPCADGKGKTIAVQPNAATSDITFVLLLTTYPVHGVTYYEVNTMMHKMNQFQGFTRWTVHKRFETRPTNKGCAIHKLQIDVTSNILMPDWPELPYAQEQDRYQWNRMWNALKAHEDGHAQHGHEFGILLREKLLGIGPQPCEQLSAIADQTVQRLRYAIQNRDAEYDARTNHGLRP